MAYDFKNMSADDIIAQMLKDSSAKYGPEDKEDNPVPELIEVEEEAHEVSFSKDEEPEPVSDDLRVALAFQKAFGAKIVDRKLYKDEEELEEDFFEDDIEDEFYSSDNKAKKKTESSGRTHLSKKNDSDIKKNAAESMGKLFGGVSKKITEISEDDGEDNLNDDSYDGIDPYDRILEKNDWTRHPHPRMDKIIRLITPVKILATICLIAVIVMTQLGEGYSDADVEAVAAAVIESVDTEGMEEASSQMFKKVFGFNADDFDGVVYYAPVSVMDAAEILIVKVKDDDQAEKIQQACEYRLETQKNSFEGYGIEQFDLLSNYSLIDVRGNFVLYVVNKSFAKAGSAFEDSL